LRREVEMMRKEVRKMSWRREEDMVMEEEEEEGREGREGSIKEEDLIVMMKRMVSVRKREATEDISKAKAEAMTMKWN
jgi:hypothetical protein